MYSLPAANEAIRLTPADPEAHRARANVLAHIQYFDDAKNELEQATSLRPIDDYLWLELGNARDELKDTEGALAALNQAVHYAPFYAHTHWQRGNLLLRMGRYSEAFADLRQAAGSNRSFMPNLIDLAWGLSRGDARLSEQLIQINDDITRIDFARFLARHGKAQEALEQFQLAATSVSEKNRRDLVRELKEAKAFKEAFQVWKGSVPPAGDTKAAIYDGGFEGPLSLEEVGFGWTTPRETQGVSLSLDDTQRDSGVQSLRIQFNGNSNPGTLLISQTIVVKPQQRYRINFAAGTKDIVSGGLPFLAISDAASGQLLGKSASLPQATSAWHVSSFEFTTPPTTDALVLSLQRSSCTSAPCPIFGFIWLDSFSIQELN
jgi:tetratricopeptide (TPR) repeat protein